MGDRDGACADPGLVEAARGDYPAGEDPSAELALEAKHYDPEVRESFIAAPTSVERPQR